MTADMSVTRSDLTRQHVHDLAPPTLYSYRQAGIKSTGRVLKIESRLMSTFFDGAVENIVRAMRETLAKQPTISTVYMVGGFSSSPLLQDAVSDGLRAGHGNVRVIAPRWPGLAIVSVCRAPSIVALSQIDMSFVILQASFARCYHFGAAREEHTVDRHTREDPCLCCPSIHGSHSTTPMQ